MTEPILSRRIERLSGSLIREILRATQQREMISFAGGLPSAELMPDIDLASAPAELRQYGASEGEEVLRGWIAKHVSGQGLSCEAGQVLITSGSQQGIDLVSKLFIDEGTPVALEAPTYLAALQSFRLFGAEFTGLALESDGIDPEQLRTVLQQNSPAFVYLIPNFQNPTGACYSLDKRRRIAALLDEFHVPLVEDDPYRELMYQEVERTPICSMMQTAPWIYLGSFSKTACPGMRLGYLACSQKLFPHLARLKQAADLHSNRAGQWALAQFLNGADYPLHLEQIRSYYRERRDAMQAALEQEFSGIAEWTLPAGGLFFWIRLKYRCDTQKLLQQALAQNIAFMPGEPFYPQLPEQGGALRLNFSHATAENNQRGIAILAQLIREENSRR